MPIPCVSRLVPANSQSFALLEDIFFHGGFRTAASVEEMNAIHASCRKAGMHVFIPEVGYFKLHADLITWLADPFAKQLTPADLYAMISELYVRQRLTRSADDAKVFYATRILAHSERTHGYFCALTARSLSDGPSITRRALTI